MPIETFDNELDELHNEDDNNCLWCDNPIASDKSFCNSRCANDYNND